MSTVAERWEERLFPLGVRLVEELLSSTMLISRVGKASVGEGWGGVIHHHM